MNAPGVSIVMDAPADSAPDPATERLRALLQSQRSGYHIDPTSPAEQLYFQISVGIALAAMVAFVLWIQLSKRRLRRLRKNKTLSKRRGGKRRR